MEKREWVYKQTKTGGSKSMKKLTKKQTGVLLVAAAAVLAFGGTYVYGETKAQKERDEVKAELATKTTNLDDLQKSIEQLFDTKDNNFLIKDINGDQVKTLNKQVAATIKFSESKELSKSDKASFDKKAKAVQAESTKLTSAYDTQTTINQLFQQKDKKPAMNGTAIQKDLPIVDDLKAETIKKAKDSYYMEGATTTYGKTVNELLSNAENQLNQIDTAKKAVEKVVKDGKVISTDTTLYDTAKAETDKIKNEKAKKNLTDQLAKVKADIDKKASEEKAKADATTQAAAAKETTNAQNNAPVAEPTNQGGTAAATADNGATATGGGYTDNGGGTNNGGGYTPPAAGGGSTSGGSASPQAPSKPSTGGNSDGSLTQDQLDKAAEDAANSDWSGFFK